MCACSSAFFQNVYSNTAHLFQNETFDHTALNNSVLLRNTGTLLVTYSVLTGVENWAQRRLSTCVDAIYRSLWAGVTQALVLLSFLDMVPNKEMVPCQQASRVIGFL